jgi:solute carrier family 25 phosphate transporter 23/24/25/41
VALNFTVYETLRSYWTPPITPETPHPQPSVLAKLFCGGVAGAVAQTCTYPLDLIRRRFQVMGTSSSAYGYHYRSTWGAVVDVVRREGLLGLYKGCLPNYLKVAPAISVSFVVYEHTKLLLS